MNPATKMKAIIELCFLWLCCTMANAAVLAQGIGTPLDAFMLENGYNLVTGPADTDILAIHTMVDKPSVTDIASNAISYDDFGYHPRTYDTAYVNITNNLPDAGIQIWGNSDECNQCKLRHLANVDKMSTKELYMDTRWKLRLAIYNKHNKIQYCLLHYHFGENGMYTYFVNRNTSANYGVECILTVNKEPRDSNIPLYIAAAVYMTSALVYIAFSYGKRNGWFDKIFRCFSTDHLPYNELGLPDTATEEPQSSAGNIIINKPQQNTSNRLKSLDTIRGISIILMIFGNYGGGRYWFFAHARWNGLTAPDLVFPGFVYISGVSMALSFHALVKYKVPRSKMIVKIIKRTVILFALGCLINGGDNITYFRVPGVLQRFSISYFVVASLQCLSATPERHAPKMMNKYYKPFRDILDYWYEWVIMACLMVVHICLTNLLPVPGCPTGYTGPGGPLVGVNGSLVNCTGGSATYIDRWILGENHILQRPTVKVIYLTKTSHDPEGILGSINSIFLTFLGLQAGKILLVFQHHGERMTRFVIWGIVLGGIGTLLCMGSKEDGWIPINKNLWSTSLVLVAGGLGFIIVTVCYFTIDVIKWWSGAPFFNPGMNPIALYAGHVLLKRHFPFAWEPVHSTHAEFLSMTLVGVTLWWFISFWMYKRNLFFKI